MGCSEFNQPFAPQNMPEAYYLSEMFRDCTSFNQDISDWCVPNAAEEEGSYMRQVFDNCPIQEEYKPKFGEPC